jgi:hypothetical protein
MKYLLAVAGTTEHSSDGTVAPEALAIMQRELPRWIEEMDGRGARLFGRELDLPETAATVRVRDGETLVTDGPFAETKEFIAGFDLLECANLNEAIEVAATSPVALFHALEVRPFAAGLQVGERARAFGRGADGSARPYLLISWMSGTSAAPAGQLAAAQETGSWRQDLQARGVHLLGSALQGPDTARTVRRHEGVTRVDAGPFTGTAEFIAGLDVLSCAGREQAVQVAAGHPFARYQAVEVRPFYCE